MTEKQLLELSEQSNVLMHKICIAEFELNSLKMEFMDTMEIIRVEMLNRQKKDLENEKKNQRTCKTS